jgi:hypothetical protein
MLRFSMSTARAVNRYSSPIPRLHIFAGPFRPNVILHIGSALSTSTKSQQKSAVVRNEDIKFPSVRVVYKDSVTGESAWKILKRDDAIKFAQSQSLDLILGKLSH